MELSAQMEQAESDDELARLGEEIDELDRLIISTPGNGRQTLIVKLETAKLLAAPGGQCILSTLDVILAQLRDAQ